MKQLLLSGMIGLLFLASCKKDDDNSTGSTHNPNTLKTTPPPPGFQFPKTFKESNRAEEFKIWVKDVDITASVNMSDVFPYRPWQNMQITLIDANTLKTLNAVTGSGRTFKYYYYQNGLYFIENKSDTIRTPVAYGNYNTIEQHYYQAKIISHGIDFGNEWDTKLNKDSLDDYVTRMGITEIDTLAYFNSHLIMK